MRKISAVTLVDLCWMSEYQEFAVRYKDEGKACTYETPDAVDAILTGLTIAKADFRVIAKSDREITAMVNGKLVRFTGLHTCTTIKETIF